MTAANDLPGILESSSPECLATGFVFTEGPLWHPDGYYFFADLRGNKLYRITPGTAPVLVRETARGNGTTFDLEGRLLQCEGGSRSIVRMRDDGAVETVVARYQGNRFSLPNDIVCRSDGSLYFSDPDKRVPYRDREIPAQVAENEMWDGASVYRLAPDGTLSLFAPCDYPNGLAFSPDERILYVANTRPCKYIHAFGVDATGNMERRWIFADMNAGDDPGVPDGVKVDVLGRVFCTGPGGIWVFRPDGKHIGTIRFPEQAVNFAFGGPDLKTLFCCARSSIYTLRVTVPGQPHPWYQLRAKQAA